MTSPVRFAGTLLLAAVVAPLPSATAQSAPDLGLLRAHAFFLADDTLRGRDTGSPEYAIAARYAATRFEAWGLAPGNGESFFQTVRFLESRVESPKLVARRGGARAELELAKDYVLLGGLTAGRLAVDAPVVFAGRGIVAPELGVDDFAGIDARGKIVLTLSGAPATFPND
jgi:hypothetical protein